MILTKTVKITITSAVKKRYQELGYECENGDVIDVKVEDLPNGSHQKVDVLCDYCKKKVSTKQYSAYVQGREYVQKDSCKHCQPLKTEEVNLVKYGVKTKTVLPEIKEKTKKTNMEKYGCENPFGNIEVQKKIKKTNLRKYGVENPLQNPDIKEKTVNTVKKKYGVENVMQLDKFKEKQQNSLEKNYGVKIPYFSEAIREKGRKTCLEKYGTNSPLGNLEIQQKAHDNRNREKIPTSSQQLYLHNLFGGELNYPLGYFYIDIFFKKQKICFEYDGTGHRLSVKLGTETDEDFDRKEVIKYSTCIRAGYKMFKIIKEKNDKLPSDEVLINIKKVAFYFLKNTDYKYIHFYPDRKLIKIHGKEIPWDFKSHLKRTFYK